MEALPELYSEISRATGFANGMEFNSEEEVLDYFTEESMRGMFGPEDEIPSQSELDWWAKQVIFNRWHCNF